MLEKCCSRGQWASGQKSDHALEAKLKYHRGIHRRAFSRDKIQSGWCLENIILAAVWRLDREGRGRQEEIGRAVGRLWPWSGKKMMVLGL